MCERDVTSPTKSTILGHMLSMNVRDVNSDMAV